MNLIVGLDPGPKKCGWVLYDYDNELVMKSGHDEWYDVREMIHHHLGSLKSICVEQVIMHMGLPPSRLIIDTAVAVGRIQQICEDNDVLYHQLPRIDICERVSGKRPKRGVKVTKADMQVAVQSLLGIPKPIRPQHANDALCAILAEYMPHGQAQTQ